MSSQDDDRDRPDALPDESSDAPSEGSSDAPSQASSDALPDEPDTHRAPPDDEAADEPSPGSPRDAWPHDDSHRAGPSTVGGDDGYRPPPSPAYAAPPAAPAPRASRTSPGPDEGARAEPRPVVPALADRPSRQGWQLLIVGLILVVVAVSVTGFVVLTDEPEPVYAFGDISAVTGTATVRAGESDQARPLEEGETVVAGWIVEAPGEAAATVTLTGGGVVRMDSGARVAFVDLAVDPETGERDGPADPVIQLDDGRAWVNPGRTADGDPSELRMRIPGGAVTTDGNPVAFDCRTPCTIEAPAGGVELVTDAGTAMAPAANEVVTFRKPEALSLTIGDGASAWARQNLNADVEADLPLPEPDSAPGIRASAVLDGTYSIALEVVGPPSGDAIPTALQYPEGETYALELVTDGSACGPAPCTVPVTAIDGASGTAEVSSGVVALELEQPIDCYDESYTSVVVPGIGTTSVQATLSVGDVSHDGDRWVVRTFDGGGTVSATLSTACNAGDVLGRSTSTISIAGG